MWVLSRGKDDIGLEKCPFLAHPNATLAEPGIPPTVCFVPHGFGQHSSLTKQATSEIYDCLFVNILGVGGDL